MWNKSKIADAKAQRGHARATIDAVGRISNDNRVLSCVVENISSTGARLRLEDDAAAHLFGPGWVLTAALIGSVPIEIRWRNVDHAGVSFEIDQEWRAHINRFVKAVIRYGPAFDQLHASPENRGQNVDDLRRAFVP